MPKRGRPFEAGNRFGRGRPRGSRNQKTILIEVLRAENTQALVRKALKLAQQGNVPMLLLFLEHVLLRPKDNPVDIGPLPVGTSEELVQSQAKVMQELASGNLSLNQAERIFLMIENSRKLLETHNLVQRVSAIEVLFHNTEPDIAA